MINYTYYRIALLLINIGIKSGHRYAEGIISLFKAMNFLSLFFPFYNKIDIKYHNPMLVGFLVLAIFIINDGAFTKDKYQYTAEYWKEESSSSRFIKGSLILAYMILSIIIFVLVIKSLYSIYDMGIIMK